MHLLRATFSLLAAATVISGAPTPVEDAPRSPPTKLPGTIHGYPPKDWECKTSQNKPTSKDIRFIGATSKSNVA